MDVEDGSAGSSCLVGCTNVISLILRSTFPFLHFSSLYLLEFRESPLEVLLGSLAMWGAWLGFAVIWIRPGHRVDSSSVLSLFLLVFSRKPASETQGFHRRFGIECKLFRAPPPLQSDRAISRVHGQLGLVFSSQFGFLFPIQQGLFIFTVFARLSACYAGEGTCFPSFIRKNQRHLGTKGEDF